MLKSDSPKHDSPCPCDHHQRTRAMNPPTSYYVGVRLFESIDFASKYENKVRNDCLTPITICQETLRRWDIKHHAKPDRCISSCSRASVIDANESNHNDVIQWLGLLSPGYDNFHKIWYKWQKQGIKISRQEPRFERIGEDGYRQ